MEILFENRTVDTTQPGYADMYAFFMGLNPGALGAMLGEHAELELPIPVFIDTLRIGLTRGDAAALEFRYRNIADFLGARNLSVWYDRFGYPMVMMSGDTFSNTRVSFDMAFLMNGRMAEIGYVFSDELVLESWRGYDLEKLANQTESVKLESGGVYRQHTDVPDIMRQIARYPDLAQVMIALGNRREDPLTRALKSEVATWEGNWSIYSGSPPSPKQQEVMDHYGVFKFLARVNCFVPTLNQIVEETRELVPVVQEVYIATRNRFR